MSYNHPRDEPALGGPYGNTSPYLHAVEVALTFFEFEGPAICLSQEIRPNHRADTHTNTHAGKIHLERML